MEKLDRAVRKLLAEIQSNQSRTLTNHPTLTLVLGAECAKLLNSNDDLNLRNWLRVIESILTEETGLPGLSINVCASSFLEATEWRVLLRRTEIDRGRLQTDRWLAVGPRESLQRLTSENVEESPPYEGMTAWLEPERACQAESEDCMVFHPSTVVAMRLLTAVRACAYDLLDRQTTADLLAQLRNSHPALVDATVPSPLSISDVSKVLSILVQEAVPIKDLVTILEAIVDNTHLTTDPELLAELARPKLAHTICGKLKCPKNTVHVITLSDGWERTFQDSTIRTPSGTFLTLDPARGCDFLQQLQRNLAELESQSTVSILVSPAIRASIRKLTERSFPETAVLSWLEIPCGVNVHSHAMIV